mmetsp:Transcript_101818/g.294657  ORF Transcript_101818/g.294657 Transcript_101818/m.294657 type:complete len:249 (+) Transcript_101818:1704-2450(+)
MESDAAPPGERGPEADAREDVRRARFRQSVAQRDGSVLRLRALRQVVASGTPLGMAGALHTEPRERLQQVSDPPDHRQVAFLDARLVHIIWNAVGNSPHQLLLDERELLCVGQAGDVRRSLEFEDLDWRWQRLRFALRLFCGHVAKHAVPHVVRGKPAILRWRLAPGLGALRLEQEHGNLHALALGAPRALADNPVLHTGIHQAVLAQISRFLGDAAAEVVDLVGEAEAVSLEHQGPRWFRLDLGHGA